MENKPRDRSCKNVEYKNDKDKNYGDKVSCEDCDRVFRNASVLRRHRKDTHLPDELKVQCPNCPAKFSRRHNMYIHMRKVHKVEPVLEQKVQEKPRKLFTCEHCPKSYCDKYKFRAHVKNKHTAESDPPKTENKTTGKTFPVCIMWFHM